MTTQKGSARAGHPPRQHPAKQDQKQPPSTRRQTPFSQHKRKRRRPPHLTPEPLHGESDACVCSIRHGDTHCSLFRCKQVNEGTASGQLDCKPNKVSSFLLGREGGADATLFA